ncbi:MAG: threonine/serine exporter ThrE family protein [Dorea sp.]
MRMQPDQLRKNHMDILWHEYTDAGGENRPVEASLTEKASIIGRVGIMLLSCGTGAWRVRSSMNTLAEVMGITCTADIGLMSIEYTCFDGEDGYTQALCLTNTGVNTSKLNRLEKFIRNFEKEGKHISGEQLHQLLDEIEKIHGLYSPVALGMAAALACGGFTFLLGGGPIEMLCAFIGAGVGNYVRCKLTKHHFTLFLCIVSSVSLACFTYAGFLKLAEILWGISVQHEAGYICAMLFIIPGFPFITSGIDLAKLDMRSGMERLAYAILVILVATMAAWIMALILHLQPVDFPKICLTSEEQVIFRLLASFCGVFGFSIMFNSPPGLAAVAAGIGAVANTLRLEFVDLTGMPPAVAAFIGALTAGILASLIKNRAGYPRISVTVPSIVIMVPGLYLYRGFYNLGMMSLSVSASWFASAMLIVMALPLGLIFARILTDRSFRYCT